LIEVLIAVVVLSVGIVLVLQSMHGALSAWDGGVERMRAAMLAQEKLEEWRLEARLDGDHPASDRGRFKPPYSEYRWEVASESVSLSGGADDPGVLQELLCTVWREGRERQFSVATRVYRPPQDEVTP
jgi:type II secretory pathway pseudopilin PulG